MSVYSASHSQKLLSHQPIGLEEYARFYAIQKGVLALKSEVFGATALSTFSDGAKTEVYFANDVHLWTSTEEHESLGLYWLPPFSHEYDEESWMTLIKEER
jgi:hypothetical protein